jgi:shikimate kinase
MKSSDPRLTKFLKFDFTDVNDHLEDKHNAEVGRLLQALGKTKVV